MVHTVELNWGKPLYHTPPSFPISQDGFCQMVCLYSGPTVTKYFNLFHFKPEKGVSGPLTPKSHELGVVITNLR